MLENSRTSVTKENVTDARKTLNKYIRVRYGLIKETLGLYALTIRYILKDNLYVIKLCCLSVPHSLNEDQKTMTGRLSAKQSSHL